MIALVIASFRFHTILLWLFLPGLGVMVFCAYVFYRNLYPILFWNKTTGKITGNEIRFERSSDESGYYAYEKATFTDHRGNMTEVTAMSSAGSVSDSVDLEVTGNVTIYYNPENSKDAIIFLWRDYVPLIFIPFGLLLIYLGWPIEKKSKNQSTIMRTIIFFTIISLAACSGSRQEQEASRDVSTFEIKRGTNIAHWLSQSNRRGIARDTFFTQKDIAFIDSAGFDHIRLPIDEVQMWDERGNRYDTAFQLLENALTWCEEAGLRVVLDLHILRSHYFNAEEKPLWSDPAEQDKFIHLWKDLSAAVKQWPTGMLAYEFMNEPVADDPEQWNRLLNRVTDSIRQWEPERVLVIGSNRFQSAETFDKLRVPENDPNIILSFHFYEPFHLTHYQASWTFMKDFTGKVNYPGQIVVNGKTADEQRVYNIDTLEHMMRKPIELAKRLNLPLYCGEFGVIMNAPVQDKLNWNRDIVTIFERNGIAYANWNYKAGSFGIVNWNLVPDSVMVDLLTGR